MEEIAVLGVGMHPWGKWGRNFVDYGVHAAYQALDDAGVTWGDVGFVSGAVTVRCGYPGYVAGSTFARALGFTGAQVASSYSACASGVTALSVARGQILSGACDVALVVGADTTPKGFLAPTEGDRPDDTDWLRFHLVGATNPVYFALHARRRMALYGATREDFALVKAKNSRHGVHNPNARYPKEYGVDDVASSPVVSDPLRLLEICATSDGGAALVVCSLDYARSLGVTDPVRVSGISTVTPTYPDTVIDLPYLATDSWAGSPPPDRGFKESIGARAYAEAGLGPEDVDVAEVYDLSSALELDWYEQLGLCPVGEAEALLRSGDTEIGGRIPVNPSGGLGAFGEAVPAQAIAQVCELAWQLRGQAGHRQVEGARVGVTANQGLFGHGSSVVVRR
ncbi:MAG: lipid-transfer protein [Actinomycetota bacterium]|nr:lipid-transfer protein [Actinomycetota bacterium]MEC9449179.1 lipid-transfer protein [Actinomycetota bacterium]MED5166504.1 lipid-transfer protein [Actinomycetota bacterium]MED5439655.1 lipid-transfer protein [Actinomycetota bacterium]